MENPTIVSKPTSVFRRVFQNKTNALSDYQNAGHKMGRGVRQMGEAVAVSAAVVVFAPLANALMRFNEVDAFFIHNLHIHSGDVLILAAPVIALTFIAKGLSNMTGGLTDQKTAMMKIRTNDALLQKLVEQHQATEQVTINPAPPETQYDH